MHFKSLLKKYESFRYKKPFTSLKEILKQRRQSSETKFKFESVLRRHDKNWRDSSALARKETEKFSVLATVRGNEKYRPLLVTVARMKRWRDIACQGRSFNDGVYWNSAGIKYTSPEGWNECIFFSKFNLSIAKDDACIVLGKHYFCCACCSAKIVNRSEITDADDYKFIIPLFKVA